jgi:hypothetical protein
MRWFVSLFRRRSVRRRGLTSFQTALALHMAMTAPARRLH